MAVADPTAPVVAGILTEYDGGDASFEARKDFFISWSRRGGGLDAKVSDYLYDAPEHVLFDLGRNIALRSKTRKRLDYPASVVNHVTSEEFVLEKRPIYLSRSRIITNRVSGSHHDLSDSLQRLYDQGLICDADIDNSYLSWARNPTYNRLGFCNTMFRVIGISPIMDHPDVPGYVIDFVLYHECLHLRHGWVQGNRVHTKEFRRLERLHPMWREAEAFFPRFRDML